MFQSTLRPEMEVYKLPLASVRKLSRRFDTLQRDQGGFGWGISEETFAALFRLTPPTVVATTTNTKSSPKATSPSDAKSTKDITAISTSTDSADTTHRLWCAWDTDKNGITDVLEILGGLTLISIGTFEDKLDYCFKLFDMDENNALSLVEMTILIRTCLVGICKLLGQVEPESKEVDILAMKCYKVVSSAGSGAGSGTGGTRSINRQQFLTWVTSVPTIISTVCKFGTTNSEQIKKKYAEGATRDKAALKIQAAFKKSKRYSGNNSNSSASASASSVAASSSAARAASSSSSYIPFDVAAHLPALKRAKQVFDSIDKDHSGSISIRELAASMEGLSSSSSSNSSNGGSSNGSGGEYLVSAMTAFRTMDIDGSGTLSFDEMLRVLYPGVRVSDLRAMMHAVAGGGEIVAERIDRSTIQALQNWFEQEDQDLDGKIILSEAIITLQKKEEFAQFVEGYIPTSSSSNRSGGGGGSTKTKNKLVTFPALLIELFSSTQQQSKLTQILTWAQINPVHHLDDKQQAELETLFKLYDTDSSGFIDMNELRTHFNGLGFSPDEISRLFAKYDEDGNKLVSLLEFKKFYRNVWDSQAKAAKRA